MSMKPCATVQWAYMNKTNLKKSQLVSLEFFIDIKSFRSHYGSGVDSASNRNEYREYFLWGKGQQMQNLLTWLKVLNLH